MDMGICELRGLTGSWASGFRPVREPSLVEEARVRPEEAIANRRSRAMRCAAAGLTVTAQRLLAEAKTIAGVAHVRLESELPTILA